MTHVAQLFVAFGMVLLLAMSPATAEAPKEMVRAEAVVQQFETEAMEDIFEDGRFVLYDAVTLKMISPEKLAGKILPMYFPSGSVADESPLRKPGQRCRFDFDMNLLKADLIFSGALDNLQWINPPCVAQHPASQPKSETAKLRSIDELLLFYPSKHPAGNWTPDDLQFEDVSFTAEDETRLHGWYRPCDSPRLDDFINNVGRRVK